VLSGPTAVRRTQARVAPPARPFERRAVVDGIFPVDVGTALDKDAGRSLVPVAGSRDEGRLAALAVTTIE